MKRIDSHFVDAVNSRQRISGFTHNFYRYPARFSPLFVRAAVHTFTRPGDVVLDPFMGGGTSLVEACAAGRTAIGTDINSLSVFIAKAKTTVMSEHALAPIRTWSTTVVREINLHRPSARHEQWVEQGYQRNINSRSTWRIRKILEMALPTIDQTLETEDQKQFARCAVLKTAQWALDCRREIPSVQAFRDQLVAHVEAMCRGANEFCVATASNNSQRRALATCLHQSAAELHLSQEIVDRPTPKLVVTSPPYPGVHVLYHRWQVQGRRETPAPYWIAASRDGDGASFYNFGDRHQQGLTTYYKATLAAFSSLAKIVSHDTIVVQMIAFSDSTWQLPEYLATMDKAGFAELTYPESSNSSDHRLWRNIPNRKFYADQKGATMSSKEVVLFHRLKQS